MTLEEQSLRDLLSSSYGPQCGQAVLECVEKGDALVIAMVDGSQRTVSTLEQARGVLREVFGWTEEA